MLSESWIYTAKSDALYNPQNFERLYQTVPQYRRDKIDKMRFAKDKCLSLGAGLLLKRALADLKIPESDAQIAYTPTQKPYLANFPDLHFNLSHAENRIMCAISRVPVGCDVERVTPISLDIAKNNFTHAEYLDIQSQSSPELAYDLFFRYWTLKESFEKATSLGLQLAMNAFCIDLSHPIAIKQDFDDLPYAFCELELEPDYKYAVCIQSDHITPHHIPCDFVRDSWP